MRQIFSSSVMLLALFAYTGCGDEPGEPWEGVRAAAPSPPRSTSPSSQSQADGALPPYFGEGAPDASSSDSDIEVPAGWGRCIGTIAYAGQLVACEPGNVCTSGPGGSMYGAVVCVPAVTRDGGDTREQCGSVFCDVPCQCTNAASSTCTCRAGC